MILKQAKASGTLCTDRLVGVRDIHPPRMCTEPTGEFVAPAASKPGHDESHQREILTPLKSVTFVIFRQPRNSHVLLQRPANRITSHRIASHRRIDSHVVAKSTDVGNPICQTLPLVVLAGKRCTCSTNQGIGQVHLANAAQTVTHILYLKQDSFGKLKPPALSSPRRQQLCNPSYP